jgi:hypothetical protein
MSGVSKVIVILQLTRKFQMAEKGIDDEVQPMAHNPRQNDRCLDHPRNGSPEVSQKLQKRIDLYFLERVGAILG